MVKMIVKEKSQHLIIQFELSKRTQISDATQLLPLFKKSHHGENDSKRKNA